MSRGFYGARSGVVVYCMMGVLWLMEVGCRDGSYEQRYGDVNT